MPRVIVATVLVHKSTGARLSPYSTLPYGEVADWVSVATGWTVAWDDGTVGTGRHPFFTEGEAAAYMAKAVARGFRGMGSVSA